MVWLELSIVPKRNPMTETASTAMIRVSPGTDPAIIALGEEIQRLAAWAEALEVRDPESVRRATEDLVLLAGLKRAIEERRKSYVGPINEHLKAVNDAFKGMSGPLEAADRTTREKVLAYRRELDQKAREAEEINRLREEAARREMALKGELTEPVAYVEESAPLPAHVRTQVGTLGTATIRKWEVEDMTKVPIEYLMVDASKIGRVVRAGIPSIPGIRIWEEETLRVTPTP